MTSTTVTTCNKCGTVIPETSSRWRATLDLRADPNASVPAVYVKPGPTEVHVCIECVQPVFGELLRNARAGASRSPATKAHRVSWEAQVLDIGPISPRQGSYMIDSGATTLTCPCGWGWTGRSTEANAPAAEHEGGTA